VIAIAAVVHERALQQHLSVPLGRAADRPSSHAAPWEGQGDRAEEQRHEYERGRIGDVHAEEERPQRARAA
jgi:hypothetical protein